MSDSPLEQALSDCLARAVPKALRPLTNELHRLRAENRTLRGKVRDLQNEVLTLEHAIEKRDERP